MKEDVKIRHRPSFEAEPDVWSVVHPKLRGERSRYLNEAVRRMETPPYRLLVPDSAEEIPVDPLLEQAYQELVLTGATLRRRRERDQERLKSKIRAGVAISVMMINPYIDKNDELYLMLLRTLGERHLVTDLIDQAKRSAEVFQELRHVGLNNRVEVQLRGCNEIPTCGVLVRDHGTRDRRMRVNLFTSMAVNRPHPHIDIDPRHEYEDARRAYDAFYDYYRNLWERAVELTD